MAFISNYPLAPAYPMSLSHARKLARPTKRLKKRLQRGLLLFNWHRASRFDAYRRRWLNAASYAARYGAAVGQV